MDEQQRVLRRPFDIETHKKTFINYLEVIIAEDGTIMYAVPSHQEKLIEIACQKLNLSREELYNSCPREYYFNIMNWLCRITSCVSVWNEHMLGYPNEKQTAAIKKLAEEGLYRGNIHATVNP